MRLRKKVFESYIIDKIQFMWYTDIYQKTFIFSGLLGLLAA